MLCYDLLKSFLFICGHWIHSRSVSFQSAGPTLTTIFGRIFPQDHDHWQFLFVHTSLLGSLEMVLTHGFCDLNLFGSHLAERR